ncbi:uncharacterized protein [Henckelia pumila]|uniref:uncharacterized protein n=1 Tax=Henckelia pumila TaxID=405737 RepID=UPI003C6E3060
MRVVVVVAAEKNVFILNPKVSSLRRLEAVLRALVVQYNSVPLRFQGILIGFATNAGDDTPVIIEKESHVIIFQLSEFADVFPDEIPGLPPTREIDFTIELVLGDSISVDPIKLEAVINWPRPTSVPEFRSFMGLAGYYRRFIKGFSTIAKPITQLTQKNTPYHWTDDCEASFIELKKETNQ